MLIFFYTIKVKKYDTVFLENQADPMADASGVLLTSQRRYVTLFYFLPLVVSRAVVTAYSPASKQPIPVDLWSERMRIEGDKLLANTRSWWRLGWFLPTFFTVLTAFALWGIMSSTSVRNLQEQQAAFFAEPRVGDIVIALDRQDPTDYLSDFRVAYKITKVDDDYLYAIRSTEKGPGGWKKLADRPAIAKGFDFSDGMFTNKAERFSRYMYNHGKSSQILQDVSVPSTERRYGMVVDLVLRPGAK